MTHDEMIFANMPLARRLAGRHARVNRDPALTPDDFYAIAYLALCRAAHAFDASKNENFAAYANLCIRGALIDHWRKLPGCARGGRLIARRADHMPELVDSETPECIASRREAHAQRAAHIERLPEREARVIFGLLGGATLAEIGRGLGVNESRTSQIKTAALKRLAA